MYNVKLEKFEGPLDLLLQIIEKNEFDITDLSLVKVADEFVGYLDEIGESRPEEMADFLIVAAKLLLIKSRLLLPSLEVSDIEDDTINLEDQLKIYRTYLLAARGLQKIINKKRFFYTRDKFPRTIKPIFSLREGITPSILESALKQIVNFWQNQIKFSQKTIKKIISLREKIHYLLGLVKNVDQLKLDEIVSGLQNDEVVVTFIATLELVKRKFVLVNQEGLFCPIVIKKYIE
ncbi:MAG: segregation/condensation protein A [Patescibacteria group bacterium]